MINRKNFTFILPSLKISGGVKETFKLADEVKALGVDVDFFSMWVSPSEVKDYSHNLTYLSRFQTSSIFAFIQLPIIFAKFLYLVYSKKIEVKLSCWVFTHYTTLPLALIIPKSRRYYFVQDMEWCFVRNKLLSELLKYFILFFYRRGTVLTANSYLTSRMNNNKIIVLAELPIWADVNFVVESPRTRTIDFVMVVRKGDAKRLDLYQEIINRSREQKSNWNFAIITPDKIIAQMFYPFVTECYLKPSVSLMSELYSKSKFFLMMSDHEGFGLPPLEAMGAGCVPICRDAGGVSAYMVDELAKFVLPLSMEVSEIIAFIGHLLNDNRFDEYSRLARHIFMRGLEKSNERAERLNEAFVRI